MTLAPIEAATSGVRSLELLSTTMTSSTKSGMACSTFATPCSSLRQGMMTVIDWPLYIGLLERRRLFPGPGRHNDDHETVPLSPRLFRRAARRGGAGRRPRG